MQSVRYVLPAAPYIIVKRRLVTRRIFYNALSVTQVTTLVDRLGQYLLDNVEFGQNMGQNVYARVTLSIIGGVLGATEVVNSARDMCDRIYGRGQGSDGLVTIALRYVGLRHEALVPDPDENNDEESSSSKRD